MTAASSPTGAEAILRALADAGVRHLFANPGTSELAFVSALPAVPELTTVLVVDETVASGAADGAARMTELPGATLLHLGPGLANAAANLHNAGKARSPIVNIVGDHASDHRFAPSPLQSDVEAIARPFSTWVGVTSSADDAARAASSAVAAAMDRRGVATLIVPSDHAEQSSSTPEHPSVRRAPAATDREDLDRAHRLLADGGAALLLGGRALRTDAIAMADRLADAVGADLWAPMFNARVERTAPTRRPLRKLPYFPLQAQQVLGGYRSVVAIDTDAPLAMFAYPDEPRRLLPDGVEWCRLGADALEDLVAMTGAAPVTASSGERPAVPDSDSLDPMLLATAVAATLPDHAVVVDEAQTSSLGLWDALAPVPHDVLMLTGGAIGSGPPLATGAAFASPGRRVVNVEGDGSALYSLGAWWTQARHGLDVTTVIAANRKYAILDLELVRTGRRADAGGPLTSLSGPEIDFVSLAAGYGVPGVRVDSVSALAHALRQSYGTPGPMVIEAVW